MTEPTPSTTGPSTTGPAAEASRVERSGPSSEACPVDPFELAATPIHLGLGARATVLSGFAWSPECLAAYDERFAADGDEGRLVTMGHNAESWTTWERHPAGEEVVLLLSGRVDVIQRVDGGERRIALAPGQAIVNPPGVWHTADVHEPGDALFITPGRGTEHEPR